MKAKFLFLTAVIVSLFTACSSDSDGGSLPVTEANVLGKWYLKATKYNNEPSQLSEFSCATSKDFNEIFSNHHIVFTGYGTDCAINDTQDSNWTLEGNTFTIIYSDLATQPDVYQLIKLSDTEMQMKQTSGSDTYIYYLNKI
jgi:hypothetical protein